MKNLVARFLSHDAGPLAQFVKYGAIGVAATCVQMVVFYVLASTCLQCLAPSDQAVRLLGLPSVDLPNGVRGLRFVVDTVVGFSVANVFCWLMNRWFVFRPGKYRWYVEFGLFFGVAALAMGIATGVSWALIRFAGMMSTPAQGLEIVVSFLMNYFVRKFVIFRT